MVGNSDQTRVCCFSTYVASPFWPVWFDILGEGGDDRLLDPDDPVIVRHFFFWSVGEMSRIAPPAASAVSVDASLLAASPVFSLSLTPSLPLSPWNRAPDNCTVCRMYESRNNY